MSFWQTSATPTSSFGSSNTAFGSNIGTAGITFDSSNAAFGQSTTFGQPSASFSFSSTPSQTLFGGPGTASATTPFGSAANGFSFGGPGPTNANQGFSFGTPGFAGGATPGGFSFENSISQPRSIDLDLAGRRLECRRQSECKCECGRCVEQRHIACSGSVHHGRPGNVVGLRALTGLTLNDTISSLAWSQAAPYSMLAVSSWDGGVNVCDVAHNNVTTLRPHSAPILDVCFGAGSSDVVFTAGADQAVRATNVLTAQSLASASAHGAAVRSVLPAVGGTIISGGFDSSVCLWEESSMRLINKLTVPDRVYAMATRGHWLVVACAERHLVIYDLRSMEAPFRTLFSALKFMTRAVEIAPNGLWFATASIEGRCSVTHFDDSQRETSDFSFKCHRQQDDVYPVNDISFHPNGVFLTVGNDNCLPLWDKESRSRLRHQSLPSAPGTIRGKFNAIGDTIAVAQAYDWSQGPSKYDRLQPGTVSVCPSGNVDRRTRRDANSHVTNTNG